VVTRTTVAWSDTSPNTGTTYGPISLDAGIKITRIVAEGCASAPTNTFSESTPFLYVNGMWGIQVIEHGNTPLLLPSNVNDPSFWTIDTDHADNELATWAPSSDTAGIARIAPWSLQWSGQAALFEEFDVWFTTGQILYQPPGYMYFGHMDVYSVTT
jgi:hypothetical protein